jgi:adenosylcobinamide kinase / adenosylcobinamide-phosphate guanylyltransferase
VPLTLLIGGARSGKSSLAVDLAERSQLDVVFVATGEAGDDEMAARIALHRAERPAHWTTVEEPLAVQDALEAARADAFVLLDCLSLWVANLLERRPDGLLEAVAGAAAAAAARPGPTVAVTNEVGLGLVPNTPLGREYRDLLGRVNGAWADVAGRVYLVVAGRVLPLEPFDG